MFYFAAEFGLTDLNYYQYLSYDRNHKIEGVNDAHEFQETLKGSVTKQKLHNNDYKMELQFIKVTIIKVLSEFLKWRRILSISINRRRSSLYSRNRLFFILT